MNCLEDRNPHFLICRSIYQKRRILTSWGWGLTIQSAWRGLMTGIFGILESSAMQWYQDVAPTQEFFSHRRIYSLWSWRPEAHDFSVSPSLCAGAAAKERVDGPYSIYMLATLRSTDERRGPRGLEEPCTIESAWKWVGKKVILFFVPDLSYMAWK